ncbi:Rieske 2Fe-2S domain-containing protein [Streptomyces sp. NPDC007070]|uniref:Rieske (2Fe-2S) protein n=1 Tax=Streptomyces sp. NPDC007070 TaxID=3154312 RepID=UPI0033EF26D0
MSERLILVEAAGRRILTSAVCPHRQGLLRFAHLDAQRLRLRCPLHNSAFDLADGSRVGGPACAAIRIVAELAEGAPLPSAEELRRLEADFDVRP